MKYLFLGDSPETGEFGHYVGYSRDTGEVTYNFEYDRAEVQDLWAAITGIREITGSDHQVALYGKSGEPGYNTTAWAIAGSLPQSTKEELDKKYSWFPQVSEIVAPGGFVLDAKHFWATLSMYFAGHGDLGGWAGDIVQYAKDLKTNSELGFPAASFGELDFTSDIDAHNIYIGMSGTVGLINSMKSYYSNGLTEDKRVRRFLTKGSVLQTRYNNSTDKSLLLLLQTQYGVTNSDVSLAISKMQEYVNHIAGNS